MLRLEGISRMHISSPNATVVMGCNLSADITESQLRRSLEEIHQAHPLVSKILSIDHNNDAWMLPMEELSFDIKSYQNQTYAWIVEKHLKDEWNIGMPLIKFLINHQEGQSQLIVSCNHAICDGLSLVYVLEDIVANLESEIIPGCNPPILLYPDLLPGTHSKWPFRLFAFIFKRKWKGVQLVLNETLMFKIYQAYWKNRDTKILTVTFDESQTHKIVSLAKAQGVTVNTYLTHLLYRSETHVNPEEAAKPVILSINLRDKLTKDPHRQVGYYVTAIRVSLSKLFNRRNYSIQLLQKIIRQKLSLTALHKSLALYFFEPIFFDLIQLNKFKIRHDRSLQKFALKESIGVKNSFALTNLGRLQPKYPNSKILTGFLPVAIVSDTIGKYVSVFTYQDQMHLAFCFDPTIISTEMVVKFKNDFVDKLNSATI